MTMSADEAAVVISVLALFLAGWSAWKSNSVQQDLLKIEQDRAIREKVQAEAAQREQGRAAILISLREAHRSSFRFLRLENTGRGTARNIEVFLNGQPANQMDGVLDTRTNFGPLPPGGTEEIKYIGFAQGPSRWDVRVTWRNENGEEGKVSSRVVPVS